MINWVKIKVARSTNGAKDLQRHLATIANPGRVRRALHYSLLVLLLAECSLKTDESIVTDAVVSYDGSVTWMRPVVYTVTSRHE